MFSQTTELVQSLYDKPRDAKQLLLSLERLNFHDLVQVSYIIYGILTSNSKLDFSLAKPQAGCLTGCIVPVGCEKIFCGVIPSPWTQLQCWNCATHAWSKYFALSFVVKFDLNRGESFCLINSIHVVCHEKAVNSFETLSLKQKEL
jgi:hypothetical protein